MKLTISDEKLCELLYSLVMMNFISLRLMKDHRRGKLFWNLPHPQLSLWDCLDSQGLQQIFPSLL